MRFPSAVTVYPVTALGWLRRKSLDKKFPGWHVWERPTGALMRMHPTKRGYIPSFIMDSGGCKGFGPPVRVERRRKTP